MDIFGLQVSVGALVGKALMLAVAVVAALVVQRVVVRVLRKVLDASNLPSASIFINIVRALIWALALLSVVEPVFGFKPDAIITGLGVVSLAVSLGMQDTISNLVSGISIMMSKAVQPGDQVTVGGVTGEVTDVTWRSTTVRTRGGAVQVIPNSVLSSTALTHETDWTVGCCRVPGASAGWQPPGAGNLGNAWCAGGDPDPRAARRGLLGGAGRGGACPLRCGLAGQCAVGRRSGVGEHCSQVGRVY